MGKRIAMVVNEAWNMYNFRKALIKKLIEDGNTVTVIAPKDEFTAKLEEMGVEVIDITINSKGVNPIEDAKLTLTFANLYRKGKYDVVFHYTIKPIIYGTVGAKMAGVRSVAVTTGLGYGFINETKVAKIIKKLYKGSLKFTQDVWFLNKQDEKEFLDREIIPSEKSFVLPGEGIDLEEFKPRPKTREDGKLVFLMVGRALWDKGVKEYFEAAEKISKRNSSVEFWFVGRIGVANPSAVPMEYIEEYEKKGAVRYLGTTDDIGSVVKEADCFVLPSYREGISRVIMEAASMRKPVIATNVPGCEELVDDGVNGFLCNVKDSVDLEKKMEKFMELSRMEKLKMGADGRRKMEREFSMENVCKIYEEFLEKL